MKTECNIINPISESIEPLREKLIRHDLYRRLASISDLQVFMEHHVYAVWDFMSLLKALQRRLTCVDVPWIPQGEPKTRALINEIVIGEESDETPDGGSLSHFELYTEAMREAGADTLPVMKMIQLLQEGLAVDLALCAAEAPECCRQFVSTTFALIGTGKPHVVAAGFTYGREDLIPALFTELVDRLDEQFPGKLGALRYYLERHIQLDGDKHGALGREMVANLCDDDPVRWREARNAAVIALETRLRLWDGINAALGDQ